MWMRDLVHEQFNSIKQLFAWNNSECVDRIQFIFIIRLNFVWNTNFPYFLDFIIAFYSKTKQIEKWMRWKKKVPNFVRFFILLNYT